MIKFSEWMLALVKIILATSVIALIGENSLLIGNIACQQQHSRLLRNDFLGTVVSSIILMWCQLSSLFMSCMAIRRSWTRQPRSCEDASNALSTRVQTILKYIFIKRICICRKSEIFHKYICHKDGLVDWISSYGRSHAVFCEKLLLMSSCVLFCCLGQVQQVNQIWFVPLVSLLSTALR